MDTDSLNKPLSIGESFEKFMKDFDEHTSELFLDNSWEIRDGHYVQFSLYQDQKRSVAETNETFCSKL